MISVGPFYQCAHVLFWAVVSFFTGAPIVQCFGFVTVAVLVGTHLPVAAKQRSHRVKAFFVSRRASFSEEAGGAQEARGGTAPGQLGQTGPGDVPCHTMPRSAIKAGGKHGAAALRAVLFVFQVTAPPRRSPVFLEVAAHLPANGRQRLNFALLARAAPALPY